MSLMSCFVYILQSHKNGSFYVGSSDNPLQRLSEHNQGRSTYTKRNTPYKLVFTQDFDTTGQARLAEIKLKSWKRHDYLEKVIKDGVIKKI